MSGRSWKPAVARFFVWPCSARDREATAQLHLTGTPDPQREHRLEELLHVEQQSGARCVADASIRVEACQQSAGPRKHRFPVSDGAIKPQGADVACLDPAIGHLVKAMEERRRHRPDLRAQRESEEDSQDALQRLIVGVIDAALVETTEQMRTIEGVRAQVLGQLELSADGIEVLRPLRVPGNGPASKRRFHLAAEILDENVQEVAVLLPKVSIAHALRPKLTCTRKHGHQKAPHVFAAIASMVDLWKYLDCQLLGL